jgi:hypothetical protein
MRKSATISESSRSAVWLACVSSLIVGLASVVIDCGTLPQLGKLPVMVIALAAFWGIVVFIIVRRPQNPTPLDLILIRWGCLPFVVCFVAAICNLPGLM